MILGGATATITAPLGWAFSIEQDESRLLEIHRWLGTATGTATVVLLILSDVARRRPRVLTLFRTGLFATVPLVMATGFFGGAMVYDIHEYDWSRPSEHDTDEAPENGQAQTHPASHPSAAVTVTMNDGYRFKPRNLAVHVGTVVRWVNSSSATHTVTDDPKIASDSNDVSRPDGVPPFNSGKIVPGRTFEHSFGVPSVYKYIREPHEELGMKGEVTVER